MITTTRARYFARLPRLLYDPSLIKYIDLTKSVLSSSPRFREKKNLFVFEFAGFSRKACIPSVHTYSLPVDRGKQTVCSPAAHTFSHPTVEQRSVKCARVVK
jgi:hypothetical protein